MQFKYVSGSLSSTGADVLALVAVSDAARDPDLRQIDKDLDGLLSERIKEQGFKGNAGETLVVRPGRRSGGPRGVVLLGGGARKTLTATALRDLAANAAKTATRLRAKTMAFAIPRSTSRDTAHAVLQTALGAELSTYRFDKYRAKESRKPSTLKTTIITGSSPKRAPITKALRRATATAASMKAARDFINEPADRMTPRQLAAEARAIAKRHNNLTVKVLGPKECEKLGMGMFLAVGRGSDEEVRLVHITYKPAKRASKRIALIGKGVTFDSGGYSLKPSAAMLDMKIDMSGSAAVIAAMDAIAKLGSPHEVHAIAACAENLVSGNAYKLGDVLTAMNGKTVEINNTDAEGRLTLGDAITYARKKVDPHEIFDVATLTGACLVALGPHTAGVLSSNEDLCKRWLAAADRAGEEMWRLPLSPRLRDQLKTSIADMKNTGGRAGGAITAGLFLKEFAGDVPWVHIDIAGPASAAKEHGATPEGATGFCVATLVEYVTH